MKKLLIISGFVFVLLFIQLSGCINTSNNNDSGFWDFIIPPISSPEIDDLLTDPKIVTMSFINDGNKYQVDYIVYKGLNDYLASLPHSHGTWHPYARSNRRWKYYFLCQRRR